MNFRLTSMLLVAVAATAGCHVHARTPAAAPIPEPVTLTSATPPAPEPQPEPEAKVEDDRIEIPGEIAFVRGSAAIAPESEDTLRILAHTLQEHSEITKVRIEGHTDSRGGAKLNKNLSKKRADAVVRWLTAHGIDAQRIEGAGMGASRPLAENDTEEHRAQNRRTEFHITEIDGKSTELRH